ncbi:hypothetical protein LY76DRAFT_273166 [Colletotrichum caudatum]|nr:hypothetical protein LY76DRAFT_273166 [Colletotrichum caudatum]
MAWRQEPRRRDATITEDSAGLRASLPLLTPGMQLASAQRVRASLYSSHIVTSSSAALDCISRTYVEWCRSNVHHHVSGNCPLNR